jgi:lipoprotein-anchoring transpeptidase ErfK/SrfK
VHTVVAATAGRGARIVISLITLVGVGSAVASSPAPPGRPRAAVERNSLSLPCGDVLGFQVRLDRHGFSPGEIDGRAGLNLRRALTAFQKDRRLPPTAKPDCETWRELGGEAGEPTLSTYEVTAEDVAGPHTGWIPSKLEEQRVLPALEYRSPLERLSERFHAAPALLKAQNPAATFGAGEELQVPNVMPFDADTKPPPDAEAAGTTVLVSRDESTLRVIRSDGTLVYFAPVSSGSEHDPLPPGEWRVTGVAWRPVFHYNPDLFWDAHPKDRAASIKPGPNNPVGVVWIDINRERFGLHGTPEPSRVGSAQSHGCVRLTNWAAARVASLVKPGTPVIFR